MGICCHGAQLLAAFIVDGRGMRVQYKGDCEETLSGIRCVYLGGGACSILLSIRSGFISIYISALKRKSYQLVPSVRLRQYIPVSADVSGSHRAVYQSRVTFRASGGHQQRVHNSTYRILTFNAISSSHNGINSEKKMEDRSRRERMQEINRSCDMDAGDAMPR